MNSESKKRVVELVMTIPRGKLTTYGTVGKICGVNPRIVGWIMSGLSEAELKNVPWPRVVAKGGIVSTLKLGPRGMLHVALLRDEGHQVEDDRILGFEDYLIDRIPTYD